VAWSAVIETTTEEAAGALSPGRVKADMLDGESTLQEVSDQLEAARLAAKDLIKRGCVGEGRIRITLTGHANARHDQGERDTQHVDRAPSRVVVAVQRLDEVDR
jgi:hypothetical protein